MIHCGTAFPSTPKSSKKISSLQNSAVLWDVTSSDVPDNINIRSHRYEKTKWNFYDQTFYHI
jgi:hypothetical protein